MTEKRFKQVVDGVKDTRTGRTLTYPLEFTLKLNEINELYDCVFDRNEELEKENEQLKKQLESREKAHTRCDELYWKLYDENEQLKKELEDALLDVKIYKNANVTFDNVYQENNKLKSRIEYLERKIQRERTSAMKEHEKWEKEIQKENEQLKQALLFFLDVANGQCSSSFQKDMEHDCQKLFNCSYSEAKDKYGDYDATWWELGE